ncbi:MAG: Gfo/Idh/MocA family oxidoreductase [Tissierellia bacterium]|nr:Gfo/Idh/MocA family oxidoreductase [Tissierellia bacterium]
MLRVALVGTGGMGTVHYMNYKHIEEVEVVALVGGSEKSRKKAQQWGLPLYDSIGELCEGEEIDVVDICSPTFLHYEHVLKALECGKYVICEKPLALSSKEAKILFEKARQVGKQLYVAQVVQFMRQTAVLRELVEKKTFGRALDGVFERLSAKPSWGSDSWMFDRKKAGLIPFDLHIHDLDLMVSLFGKPREFRVYKSQSELSFPEHFRFIYDYDGLNLVGEAGWLNANMPFRVRWRVYFERAYVVSEEGQLIAYPADGQPIVYNVEEKELIETGINVPPTEMYLTQLRHFIDCIKLDIPSPIVKEEQVISTLEILENIQWDEN